MRGRTVLAALLALASLGGAAASAAPPTPSLDVLTWPGEQPGPLQWKLWRVRSGEPMRAVTLDLPPGVVRAGALRALRSAPQARGGATVGSASVTIQSSPDSIAVVQAPLIVDGCPGAAAGPLATLRFETGGSCVNVPLDSSAGDGIEARLELTAVGAVTAIDLRLDSLQTTAGRLLPANPEQAAVADSSATVDTASGTAAAAVREIVGGTTSVVLEASAAKVDYGREITLSGQVVRAGAPSAGETVALGPFFDSVANTPVEPGATVTTDADGRFTASVRPTATGTWTAWSSAPATADRPTLNTIAGVSATAVSVRAPRPSIERRRARRLRHHRARAEIVVRNPIARMETLQCRLYVGGALVATRRFPTAARPLVFDVTGSRSARVRAAIGRWDGPQIAPRSSRVIRLWPKRTRRP